MSVPGKFSETKDATKETQKLCDQVKPEVEKKTGKKFKEYVAVTYREQIVAGTNFLIKVHVGGVQYIHLSVFEALDGTVELNGVQENHTKDDPLVPFLK
ncbi:leukocyte cysteine proteinase inhibitor 1-like isoform X3 [Thunnus albacares]|uniref:leukocyte cysteine proteinase inhibitor 1-like isoform X3 n=1 Tax=Thunnus albacares TaxID=8236 RepID=UPI001CF6D5C1|nr:leukocyte cysteine proteinase inhibitor 1-like isoform X3 [Thunnus albacares]